MKKSFRIFLVIQLVALGLFAQRDPKAKEVLDKMNEKYQNIPAFSASFIQQLENKMEGISDQMQGTIVVMGDRFYIDLGDQLLINDGKTVWIYIKDANEVTIDHYYPEEGDMNPTSIFNAYKQGYKYRYLAGEGAAKYHVIELEPENKDNPFFKIRMNVRKSDNLLEKWSMFERSGNVFQYEVQNFKERSDIKASYFKFDASKYPGVEILDFR
jgi:outer membrane lipoprotein carrier protein